MNKTVGAIQSSIGMNEPVQNVWTSEAIQAYEDMLMKKALEESLQEEVRMSERLPVLILNS